jgi:hypothetical protein
LGDMGQAAQVAATQLEVLLQGPDSLVRGTAAEALRAIQGTELA